MENSPAASPLNTGKALFGEHHIRGLLPSVLTEDAVCERGDSKYPQASCGLGSES